MKIGWYKNSYRRSLVDMHIEDWNDEFLSKLSAEDYCENLKKGKIQSAMIYFQNHNGHCYFPTKVGHTHKMFLEGENQIKRLVDLCHENGIDVIGYYSLIFNTYEEDRHPDWRIFGADGKSERERGGKDRRYGHCCPNNPEYREFLKVQIKEMLDYFDVDGMFYDMTYWPQFCGCKHCSERYEKETGKKEMPLEKDFTNPDYLEHRRKRAEWMGEFAKFVTEYTRELQPGITVEHNYASSVAAEDNQACSSEVVNDWCDYTGGDLYGSLYNHSFVAKYYRTTTQKQPYEYMTCRCDPRLYQHTITKSEKTLETEVMQNVANHAATLIIDAIDPRGTMDSRVYERIGKIFDKEIQYESHMTGEPICDLGMLFFTLGYYNSAGQDYDHRTASVGAATTIIEKNIQYNVLPGNRAKLDDYKCIVAPAVADVNDDMVEKIAKYVENGGTFYFSGVEEPKLLSRLLNAEYQGMSDYSCCYIAPKKKAGKMFGEFNAAFPMPVEYYIPIVKTSHSENVIAYVTYPYTNPFAKKFASIHSNPPGVPTRIPAAMEVKLGKGTVIWSAFPIENDLREGYKTVFGNILDRLLPKKERSVIATASRQVELVVYDMESKLQVNAINLLATEERLALPSFRVSVKSQKAPKKVASVTTGKNLPFTYKDGMVNFSVRSLKIFEMFEIEF